jgi:hypothetical protein
MFYRPLQFRPSFEQFPDSRDIFVKYGAHQGRARVRVSVHEVAQVLIVGFDVHMVMIQEMVYHRRHFVDGAASRYSME